jgi:hypothetical protein
MPRNPLTYGNEYQGVPILPEPEHGNHLSILDAIHRTMTDMVDRHCGFGVVADNHHVEEFMGEFAEYLSGRGIDYRYCWVREQPAPGSQPHWHVLILLDGNRTWSFFHGHLEAATRIWGGVLGGVNAGGLVDVSDWHEAFTPTHPYVGNGGVMIDRNSAHRDKAFVLLHTRSSYLAKAITKEFTPKGLRKFSASLRR